MHMANREFTTAIAYYVDVMVTKECIFYRHWIISTISNLLGQYDKHILK